MTRVSFSASFSEEKEWQIGFSSQNYGDPHSYIPQHNRAE